MKKTNLAKALEKVATKQAVTKKNSSGNALKTIVKKPLAYFIIKLAAILKILLAIIISFYISTSFSSDPALIEKNSALITYILLSQSTASLLILLTLHHKKNTLLQFIIFLAMFFSISNFLSGNIISGLTFTFYLFMFITSFNKKLNNYLNNNQKKP